MKSYLQAGSLAFFTLLFILASYRLPDWLPADIYLRLDPLPALLTSIATRTITAGFFFGFALILTALLLGRFFCGYICPLGAILDLGDRFFPRHERENRLRKDRLWRRAKHYLLASLFAAAALGLPLMFLFDPIVLLTRFYSIVLYPLVVGLINLLADLLRPLFEIAGLHEAAYFYQAEPVFYAVAVTAVSFAGIVALGFFMPRFWCRYLCPLGAFLGWFSLRPVFQRQVSDRCNDCMKCARMCPMGAIEPDPRITARGECILCLVCEGVCPRGAVNFSARQAQTLPVDIPRRGLVLSATGGLLVGFFAFQTPSYQLAGKIQLIRPPGSLPEREFLRTCVRCGECLKACVTNTLQPARWEKGLAGLWAPKMVLRLAACEPNCNACGRVCPTQAIRSLPLNEKNHARVGTAILWRERCVVWAEDRLCLICDEICPYNAIVFRPVDGFRRPFVIPSRCNGCGYCEEKCPIAGESAITIVTAGEIRLSSGSYIEAARRLQLEFKPDAGEDMLMPMDPQ